MTVGNEIAYYLRPVNGSDSNDGKSFAGAWKTWEKAMELCTTAGATADNAILFLVNEGGAYTGPYHSGLGESTAVDYFFTTGTYFEICGLSADGSYDPNTNFEFDLSGFTGQDWLYAFGGPADKGILFRNITWKNATRSTNTIVGCGYQDPLSLSIFTNCVFQDNELNNALFGNGGYGAYIKYENCRFIRNNTYATAHSMFSDYSTTGTPRGNGSDFVNCVFDSNQTDPSSSNYVTGYAASFSDGVNFNNCVFYNNGYDADSVCVLAEGSYVRAEHVVQNCTFFNNAGTAIKISDPEYSDGTYNTSNFACRLHENVFMYNNKSIDFQIEPGLRYSVLSNNVFYNNTVEDIPDLIETLPGISGGNHVFDPEFTNGYSGDFSVPHDSRLFSYSTVPGVPIGGSFVQKKSFTTTTSGSLSFGSGEVGDTVTVSGKSYQKVNASPPVWRRYFTTPPLSGTFSPSSVSGIYAWYDASTDVVTSGTDVTSWTNKVSGGTDMVSVTAPTLVSAGQNGLDVIRFVTGDENLDVGNINDNLSNWNAIAVFKPTQSNFLIYGAVGAGYYVLAALDGSSSNVNSNSGSPTFSLNGSSWSPADRNDVHDSLYGNFNIVGSFNVNMSSWGGRWGLGYWDGNEYDFEGDFAEIIVFSSTPSASDQRKIEGYLAHKWGLAGNLTSNHPFKNYAP